MRIRNSIEAWNIIARTNDMDGRRWCVCQNTKYGRLWWMGVEPGDAFTENEADAATMTKSIAILRAFQLVHGAFSGAAIGWRALEIVEAK